MKILFDTEEIAEHCNGCDHYGPHYAGKADTGHAFKCKLCGRLTVWEGGEVERVVSPGNPPAGV